MPTLTEFQKWSADRETANANAASVIVTQDGLGKPDEVAMDLGLGREFGALTGNPVPPLSVVQEFKPAFQAQIEQKKASTILSSSPMLSSWLRNDPEAVSLARDDLDNLAWYEAPFSAAGRALKRGGLATGVVYNQMIADTTEQRARDRGRGFGDLYNEEKSNNTLSSSPIESAVDIFLAGSRYMSTLQANIGDEAKTAELYQQRAGEVSNRIAAIPKSVAGQGFQDALPKGTGNMMEDLRSFGQAVKNDPGGFTAFITETALESAPVFAAAAVATAATRNPIVGATFMGGSSAAMERYTTPVDFFKEKGLDVSKPEDAEKVFSDPDLWKEAAQRGVIRGLIVGTLDGISGGVAGKALAENPVTDMVLQSLTQMAFAGAGEASAQLASGQPFDLNSVLIEVVAEIGTLPIEVGGVGGRAFLDNRRNAKDAEGRKALFTELSGQAVNSKLRARMPDKFREFVDRATANGPVENVFIPADKFAEYFQSVGADPFELMDELPGASRADLESALATGGDIQIPTATYAANIAGSDHDAFLIDHMRFDPDDMTYFEAQEFNARAAEAMQEAYGVAEELRQDEESLRADETVIYDTMVSRLREAGRSTDVATTEALLYPAFYRTLAARSGLTTEELMQKFPLPQVKGDLPAALEPKNVDELTRTLAAARTRKSGKVSRGASLFDFVSDFGVNDGKGTRLGGLFGMGKKAVKGDRGEIAAIMDGRSTHKVGAKKMLRPDGVGVDDAAYRAFEAGYLDTYPVAGEYRAATEAGTEAPDLVPAFLDAMEKGSETFVLDESVDADVDAQNALDQVEEYLASIGVSLDDSDEAIRAALDAEKGKAYGQARADGSAFLEWFGESKVVDANGAPLVMYHGTHADDIPAFDKSKIRADDFDTPFNGFWFSSNEDTGPAFSSADTTIKVYLSIQNPAPSDVWKKVAKDVREDKSRRDTSRSDGDEIRYRLQDMGYDGIHYDGAPEVDREKFEREGVAEFRSLAGQKYTIKKDATDPNFTDLFDGWGEGVENNHVTGYGDFDDFLSTFGGEDTWVAFEPTQIKSTANAGTFDPNDPRIMYQAGTGPDYPLAPRSEWYGEANYEEAGGKLVYMKPADYLAAVRPLTMDDESRENVDLLKAHIESGKTLDPLKIFDGGKEDGRHRAYAAMELGIPSVPVIVFGNQRELFQPAYHGTPHLFERFSLEKMGTGEGAQAFGWGMYFAGQKSLAEHYRRTLAGDVRVVIDGRDISEFVSPASEAADKAIFDWVNEKLDLKMIPRPSSIIGLDPRHAELFKNQTFVAGAVREVLRSANFDINPRNGGEVLTVKQSLFGQQERNRILAEGMFESAKVSTNELELTQRGHSYAMRAEVASAMLEAGTDLKAEKPGRLLKVDLPSDEELLDWDKSLADQPPKIKAALEGLGFSFIPVPKIADPEVGLILRQAMREADGDPLSARDVIENDQKLFNRTRRLMKRAGVDPDNDENPTPGYWIAEQARDHIQAILDNQKLTGESIYKVLSQDLSPIIDAGSRNDRAASEALRAAGIPGHRFLDGMSRRSGEGSHNYVIYDEEAVNVLEFEQANGQGPRGSIVFPLEFGKVGDGETVINLFRSADLSTFVHETGHYFLSMYQALATAENADPGLRSDYVVIRDWWRENAEGVAKDAQAVTGTAVTAADVIAALDNSTTGDRAKDLGIDVGMQEQWARAFETYLMEGKAPTVELRTAFEKFRSWLMSIYRRMLALDVKVSPEIKGVFDRLLATDHEIATAASSSGGDALIFASAEEMGVSAADYAALVRLHTQAQDDAAAKLLRETMAPIKRAKEAWYREEKKAVTAEVSAQINAAPIYRAFEWIGNRRWLGDGKPEGLGDIRFSKELLVERYGDGVLKTLPRGRFKVYAVEGGYDPDEIAGWFGFGSGDELVSALENMHPRKDAIANEADRVMVERHGDALNDGSIEAEALDAFHNNTRGRVLAEELRALTEIAGDTKPALKAQEAREIARRTIAGMKVRDAMRTQRFLAAERKAGREAARLGEIVVREKSWAEGARRRVANRARRAVREESPAVASGINPVIDKANKSASSANDNIAALIEAKRRQLLNHAFYTRSREVEAEVEAAENLVARLSKKSTREKLAGDYLDAIDEVIERYDFRKLSAGAEERRGSLKAYIDRMVADGRENELNIPPSVLNDAKRTPYKTLSVEHLRGVVETLKNIEHTARLKKKLVDAKQERELDEVVEKIAEAFDANVKKRPPSRAGRPGLGERARNATRQFLDIVLNAETLLREIDGFGDHVGAAYRNLKAPIDDAMSVLTVKRREAAEAFDRLYAVYSRPEKRKMSVKMSIPELGGSFAKWDLISIALNMGNEDNVQRLTDERVPGSFTHKQVEMALNRLDARDWKFVQSAWDYIDTFWPEIEARERRITGVAPKKVEAREVNTPHGKFRGGYYPLKYDARLSGLTRDDELGDINASMAAGRFGKAQTRNGHTKERAKAAGRPVMIDIGVLHGHVNQVIHDLALSEVVNNSWRILQDGRIKDLFIQSGRKPDFDALEIWLQDVAAGEQRSGHIVQTSARRLKTGFTVSKLAFKVTTAALQVSGLAQSVVVVGKKDMAAGILDAYARRPWYGEQSAATEVMAKSPFMAERESTFNKDIYDVLGDTRSGPTQGRVDSFVREVIAPLGFWMMQKVQFYAVDLPTWLAGYRKGLRVEGGDETKAIAYADRIVARAAASGLWSDRTAIERGSLTRDSRQNDVVRLFTALGSYMFAKANVAYSRTSETTFSDPRQVMSWAMDMVMLFTVEAVITAAVKGQLPGDDEDEDEAGAADWALFLAKQTGASIAGSIPFVRDGVSALQGYSGGGAYGSTIETMAKPFTEASQGVIDKQLVKAWIDLGGMFLNLPSAQVNVMVDGLWRQSEGEDVNPAEFIFGKR